MEIKQSVPLAFYPSRKLINATMEELLSNSETQAKCLQAMQKQYNPLMLVRMTELWVEAEAFGAEIEISENAFPRIVTKVIPDVEDIADVKMPSMNSARLPVFVEGIRIARELMSETLLFAGITAPFSLCSCLTDAQDFMVQCYADPDAVHGFLTAITEFLIEYCNEYKKAGASGVFIAEPSICMLSPEMAKEFSHNYVKKIIENLQTDDFKIVYHNCGDVTLQLEDIKNMKAAMYHFGDAVAMKTVLEKFPKDVPILGNVHPSKFTVGNEEVLKSAIEKLKKEFADNENFILSSGCDIAPNILIENVELLK